jgi:serine/threonine protein kinase
VLSAGETLRGDRIGHVRIVDRVGGGAQGEVYRAEHDTLGQLAVKWYKPAWATQDQARVLDDLIARGAPDPRFLWPLARLSRINGTDLRDESFGYAMPLCEAGYIPLVRLVNGKLEPDRQPGFADIIRICQHIVESFRLLHLGGLCYRDLSLANIFFEPETASVRICDVDNVSIDDGSSKVLGTPLFMAPEIVRDTEFGTFPSRSTDLHSLAVVLFFLLFIEHPLIGRKVDHGIWDEQHALRHFGREPVFVFDPEDHSNRPVSAHVERYWTLYPEFLRARMLAAFVAGLRDPSSRVTEGEWLRTLGRLRDSMGTCPGCGATVFYDFEALDTPQCHACRTPLQRPLVLAIGKRQLVVSRHLQFGPEVVDPLPSPGPPIAKSVPHPTVTGRFGLKNLTGVDWVVTMPDGSKHPVRPSQAVELSEGVAIRMPTISATARRA